MHIFWSFVRNHLFLFAAAATAGAMLFSRLLFGQDAPVPAEIESGGWQVFWVIVWAAGGFLASGVAWLIGMASSWIRENHGHKAWAGFLTRFIEAVEDELQLAWVDLQTELGKARSPGSPGGEKITSAEQKRLGRIVWEGVKSRYGGFKKLMALGARIIGGDAERALKGAVDRRVADAVEGQVGGKPGPRRALANP